MKEIEAFVRTLVFDNSSGDLLQFSYAGAWIVDSRYELHVPAIGRNEELRKGWKGVDPLLHLSELV